MSPTNPTPRSRSAKRKPEPTAPDWVPVFLAALAATGIVEHSARAAGIHKDTVYEKRKSDPGFKRAMRDAIRSSISVLELEGRRRAVEGVDHLVTHKGEPAGAWMNDAGEIVQPRSQSQEDLAGLRWVPIKITKYSDTLLMFLLSAADKRRYGKELTHKGKIEHHHKQGQLTVDDLSDAELLEIVRQGKLLEDATKIEVAP